MCSTFTARRSVAEISTPGHAGKWRSRPPLQNRFLLDYEGGALVRGSEALGQSGKRLLSQRPPEGSYTLVSSAETFVDVLTSSTPVKRLRLSPAIEIQPCTAITVSSGTSAVVDCQGSTLDLRCATSFHVDSYARLQLFNCHILWSTRTAFFNIVAETDTLRVEQGASLEQFHGSSTLDCNVRLHQSKPVAAVRA